MQTIEQELKISLNQREYQLLLETKQGHLTEQTNYYFVSQPNKPDRLLRVRYSNGCYVLCMKTRLSNNNGVSVSSENSVEITRDLFNSFAKNGISKKQLLVMLNFESEFDYKLCGQLLTQRTTFDLDGFNIQLDKNIYLDTVDFELECEHIDILQFEKLKGLLKHKFSIDCLESKPKSQRFFERLKDVQLAQRLNQIRAL